MGTFDAKEGVEISENEIISNAKINLFIKKYLPVMVNVLILKIV